MALTQSAAYQSTAANVTHTCTFGFTATAGQDLIALVSSNAVLTTPSGWTKITPAYDGSSPMDIAIYRKTATGSEASLAVTGSAANTMSIRILQFDSLGATGGSVVGTASVSSFDVQTTPVTLTANGYVLSMVSWSNTTASIGTAWAVPFGNILRQGATGGSEPIVMTTAFASGSSGTTVSPATSPGIDGIQVQAVSVQLATISAPTVPTVSAGSNQSSIEPGATVTLAASILDNGGSSITQHIWRQVSGPTATFSATNAASVTYQIVSSPNDVTAVFGYKAVNATGTSAEATVSHTILHNTEQMGSGTGAKGVIFHTA